LKKETFRENNCKKVSKVSDIGWRYHNRMLAALRTDAINNKRKKNLKKEKSLVDCSTRLEKIYTIKKKLK